MFCFINTPAHRLEDKRKSNIVQTNDECVTIIEIDRAKSKKVMCLRKY